MIHIQKWAPIEKEDAHVLLRSWGYGGFVGLDKGGGSKRKTRGDQREPATSAKKKAKKPLIEEDDEVDEVSEEAEVVDVRPPLTRGARSGAEPKGSVGRALQASNILDGLLAEGTQKNPEVASNPKPRTTSNKGPLEEKLGDLREKLKARTDQRKGTAAAALADKAQAAASGPRRKRRRSGAEDVVKGLQKVLGRKSRSKASVEIDESDSEDFEDDEPDIDDGTSVLSAKRRQLKQLAQDRPGVLLTKGLQNMREQVGSLYGEDGEAEDGFSPIVNRYLLSVIHPNYPPKAQSEEMMREMRTLALGLDLILRGRIDSAADLMMQRFKSCCMHLRDGQGHFGHFLELLPDDLLGGGASLGETEFARSMAVRTAKANALLSKVAAP